MNLLTLRGSSTWNWQPFGDDVGVNSPPQWKLPEGSKHFNRVDIQ